MQSAIQIKSNKK